MRRGVLGTGALRRERILLVGADVLVLATVTKKIFIIDYKSITILA